MSKFIVISIMILFGKLVLFGPKLNWMEQAKVNGGLCIMYLQNALFGGVKVKMIIILICNITWFHIIKILCKWCLVFSRLLQVPEKPKFIKQLKLLVEKIKNMKILIAPSTMAAVCPWFYYYYKRSALITIIS